MGQYCPFMVDYGKGRRERWVPLSDGVADLVRSATAGGGWALPGLDEGHLSLTPDQELTVALVDNGILRP